MMNLKDYLEIIQNSKLKEIKFERGLGLIDPMFILYFEKDTAEIILEVYSNFRIRTNNEVLLAFNDLYLDTTRKEISIRRFRQQKDIEKTYLSKSLAFVNKKLNNSIVYKTVNKRYGDLILYCKNKITIEIQNDTHLESCKLFNIKFCEFGKSESISCQILNNQLVYS